MEVSLKYRIRSSVIRERDGVKGDIVTRLEKGMLSWLVKLTGCMREDLLSRFVSRVLWV